MINYPFIENVLNINLLGVILLVDLIALFLFFIKTENKEMIKHNYLKGSLLFLVSYLIVSVQRHCDLFFGFVDGSNPLAILYPEYVVKSACLASVGLLSYFIGYIFCGDVPFKMYRKRSLIPLRIIVCLLFIILLLYVLTINPEYVRGGYVNDAQNSSLNGSIFVLLESLFFAYLVAKMYNANCLEKVSFKSYVYSDRWYLLILCFYLFIVLLSGDRGPIIYLGLSYLYSYLYIRGFKMNKIMFILLVLISALFVTILGVVRNQTDQMEHWDFTSKVEIAINLLSVKEQTSLIPPTEELANSGRCVQAALKAVDTDGLWWGYFNFYQIITALPFMGQLVNILGVYDGEIPLSSQYITYLIQGRNPRYGDGSSCVADLYLDFGVLGVSIGLFFLGLLYRKIDLSTSRLNLSIFTLSVMFVYFSMAISLARNPYLFCFKRIFIIYFVLYFIRLIWGKKYIA